MEHIDFIMMTALHDALATTTMRQGDGRSKPEEAAEACSARRRYATVCSEELRTEDRGIRIAVEWKADDRRGGSTRTGKQLASVHAPWQHLFCVFFDDLEWESPGQERQPNISPTSAISSFSVKTLL